jgi:hypothetical protein
MIATMVFSTILVAITFGVMHFSALYYKGVYTSETQNVARDIMDQVTDAVKYGTGEVYTIEGAPGHDDDVLFCAGGYVFYIPRLYDKYLGNDPSKGFYMQPMTGDTCSAPSNTNGRKQLLAKNMRVAKIAFMESDTHNVYTFSITIAYGDNDLLTDSGDTVQCNAGAGNEYCAVSSLVTTIKKRI